MKEDPEEEQAYRVGTRMELSMSPSVLISIIKFRVHEKNVTLEEKKRMLWFLGEELLLHWGNRSKVKQQIEGDFDLLLESALYVVSIIFG